MSSTRFIIGDVFDGLAALKAEGTQVDLVLSSPPFLALRSYLPADHPDKGKEIGSEPTPAAFLSTMLDVVEACADVLAPTGTLAFEFGDTYAGSGGAGGDYAVDGLRDGQERFNGAAATARAHAVKDRTRNPGAGWPLDKSMCMIPELFAASLAYGRNLLDPDRTTDPWRIRNTIAWVRPNPPVGALGDKFRPAKSLITVACKARDRWFDLDAVRTPHTVAPEKMTGNGYTEGHPEGVKGKESMPGNPAGAPPLDWWKISPGGYSGKVSTSRRVRCGPDDGGERTTSPDCPVHADLPGQLPRALRDERAAAQSRRTPRTDDRHAQGQLLAGDTNGSTPDRSGSSLDPTSESSDPTCSDAATPRSTASSRTGPAPATTSPDTASGRSPRRTGDTSASPLSGATHPDSLGSRTSEACPTADEPESGPRTAGNPDPRPACTCSFWRTVTESTSHYAVWPPELLHRPIEAMCPRRVCRTCGTPSRREMQASSDYADKLGGSIAGRAGKSKASGLLGSTQPEGDHITAASYTTTGWTSCGCPGTDGIRLDGYHTGPGFRPGIVLDPFGGSGTTGLVANGLSRDAILLDLDERNADLARERLGMFLTVEHLAREGVA